MEYMKLIKIQASISNSLQLYDAQTSYENINIAEHSSFKIVWFLSKSSRNLISLILLQ